MKKIIRKLKGKGGKPDQPETNENESESDGFDSKDSPKGKNDNYMMEFGFMEIDFIEIPLREPLDKCQCPEPKLEPGFPRWWKKVEAPKKKSVEPKNEPPEEEPPKEHRVKLKCRGANHILDGPCVCDSETEIRFAESNTDGHNKDFFVYRGAREIQTPYAFVRAHPGEGFPGHVGDAVHLVFKDKTKREYECRLADGTERHATIGMEFLDVIVDVDNILEG